MLRRSIIDLSISVHDVTIATLILLNGFFLLLVACTNEKVLKEQPITDRKYIHTVAKGIIYSKYAIEKAIPQWKKANICKVIPMYNLSDKISAYWIEIECDESGGYIIMSAFKNSHPIYSLSPTPIKINRFVDKCIQIFDNHTKEKAKLSNLVFNCGLLFPYVKVANNKTTVVYRLMPFITPTDSSTIKKYTLEKYYETCSEVNTAWDYYYQLGNKVGNKSSAIAQP